MSFEPTLQKMVKDCPGALGIALMGSDGIPVEEVTPERSNAELDGSEIVGGAGVEFGRLLDEMRKASDALGGGRLEESIVSLARFTLLFRSVDDELFVVVALAPDGNLGKARYLVRRHLLELREQL
jgi:predicted regulator of Ras-like GTPase activity (Roadblock/LC7/MglB family)